MPDNTGSNKLKIEKLEELLRSARPDIVPSPGFKEKLREQLLAKAQSYDSVSDLKSKRHRNRVITFRILAATAACMIFAVGFYFMVAGGVNSAAGGYAEMLSNIRRIKTVSFEFTYSLSGEPEHGGMAYMKYPGQIRIVFPGEKITIVDADQEKILVLRPNEKTASFIKNSSYDKNYVSPLEQLRQAGDSTGEFLGKEILAGKKVDVYLVTLSDTAMRIWVDPQKELPVRIESRLISGADSESVIVIKHIKWNPSIPESFFILDAPSGYKTERTDIPSEASFLDFMHIRLLQNEVDVDILTGLVSADGS